jgi:hypothetical protein
MPVRCCQPNTQVPPVPSQLVATLGDLLWATAELREVLSIDVTPDLWQVLLSHAQPHWVLPPASAAAAAALVGGGGGSAGARAAALRPWLLQPVSSAGRDQLNGAPSASAGGDGSSSVAASSAGGAAAGAASSAGASGPRGSGVPVPVVSMVQAYGEWFTQAVVRDARGLGVMFAPQLRQFVCLAGPADALSQRACLPELTALLQVRRCAGAGAGCVCACAGHSGAARVSAAPTMFAHAHTRCLGRMPRCACVR